MKNWLEIEHEGARSSIVKPYFGESDKILHWQPNKRLFPRKEKPVTIGIGFKFPEGILLCADTQHTYQGIMKIKGTKLFGVQNSDKLAAAFGFVGDSQYAMMAIQQCTEDLLSLDLTHISSLKS